MSWLRCVGCNTEIGWDGKGVLCYTCPCGGHIFYDDKSGHISLPLSLITAMREKKNFPHLDYLVGRAGSTSPLKEHLIAELEGLGAIWMKDCPVCLSSGAYQAMLEGEKAQAVFEAEIIVKSEARK